MYSMRILDKNDKEVKNGDIIDLHQTVNGQNLFVVMSLEPLDIRYAHDLNCKYQYDQDEIFRPCKYSGTVEYEMVANIYESDNGIFDDKIEEWHNSDTHLSLYEYIGLTEEEFKMWLKTPKDIINQ